MLKICISGSTRRITTSIIQLFGVLSFLLMETYASYLSFSVPLPEGAHYKLTSSQKFSLYAVGVLIYQLVLEWGIPLSYKKETFYICKFFVNAALFAFINPIVIIFSSEAILTHSYHLFEKSSVKKISKYFAEIVSSKNKISPEM